MAGRCDCAKECSCAQIGSDSIQVVGTGNPTAPFTPGVKLRAGLDNLLEIYTPDSGAPGLAAYERVKHQDGTPLSIDDNGYVVLPAAFLRDAGGNIMEPEPDGSVVLPPGGTPLFGTGLELVDGALVPAVNDGDGVGWPTNALDGSPFGGTAATLSPLYRTEEGLFGPPEHTALRAGGGETLYAGGGLGTGVTGTYTSPVGTVWSLTNPSPNRRMLVFRQMLATVDLQTPVGGIASIVLDSRINGGAWSAVRALHWPAPTSGTQAIRFEGELSKAASSVINPGATHTVQLRVRAVREGSGSDVPVMLGASAVVEMFGVTV